MTATADQTESEKGNGKSWKTIGPLACAISSRLITSASCKHSSLRAMTWDGMRSLTESSCCLYAMIAWSHASFARSASASSSELNCWYSYSGPRKSGGGSVGLPLSRFQAEQREAALVLSLEINVRSL